jgi:hypothetical protein
MESRATFFAPTPDFQANSLYLNEIKRRDILTLNTNPFCFWYIVESRGFFKCFHLTLIAFNLQQQGGEPPQWLVDSG